jgi:DNA-binding MarR family transcriptional regulator
VTADELSTTPELASALRTSILRLARRLRQMKDDRLDLSGNQLSAMAVLLNHGDQLMGELAAAERVQPPSMTRIVNGLEARGLVARKPDPRDGRQCLVTLTEPGREILLANRRRRDAWLSQRIEELSPEEQDVIRQAVGILDRVRNA